MIIETIVKIKVNEDDPAYCAWDCPGKKGSDYPRGRECRYYRNAELKLCDGSHLRCFECVDNVRILKELRNEHN